MSRFCVRSVFGHEKSFCTSTACRISNCIRLQWALLRIDGYTALLNCMHAATRLRSWVEQSALVDMMRWVSVVPGVQECGQFTALLTYYSLQCVAVVCDSVLTIITMGSNKKRPTSVFDQNGKVMKELSNELSES